MFCHNGALRNTSILGAKRRGKRAALRGDSSKINNQKTHYVHRKGQLDLDDLYDMQGGRYHYQNGWNRTAVTAFGLAAVFSVATVWVPWFGFLSGYNWVIGAVLGGGLYTLLAKSPARV